MKNKLSQHPEPEVVPFCLSDGDVDFGTKIKIYDEGYLKYKINSDNYHVVAIYIKKEFREKHLGTEWMKEAEKHAKELGLDRMIIEAKTNGKDDVLGRFIVSLGYKLVHHGLWDKKI